MLLLYVCRFRLLFDVQRPGEGASIKRGIITCYYPDRKNQRDTKHFDEDMYAAHRITQSSNICVD